MSSKSIKADKKSLAVLLFSALLFLSGLFRLEPSLFGLPDNAVFSLGIQNMTAVCTGILLGGFQGAASVGLYILSGILLGFFGIPFFNTGVVSSETGMAYLQGAGGGFVFGYFLAAAAAGFLCGTVTDEKLSIKKLLKASCIAFILIYVSGIVQFLSVKGFTFSLQQIKLVFTAVILPYLPFDAVKVLICVLAGRFLRPFIARIFFLDSSL